MSLCFAVLAHTDRPALADLVANLRTAQPGCEVVVFNGGLDLELAAGLDVEVCPTSRPLRHGHLAPFHGHVLTWLADRDLDWIVTLDSDVLLVRAGLEAHLSALAADYVAPHLSPVRPGTPWRPGRRFLRSWADWQPLLPVEHPWRCFNPVQAFGRGYREVFAAWPGRSELLARVDQAPQEALEEIVWPTVAGALGLRIAPLGGDDALRLRPPTPYELRDHLADPAVFAVHKVRTSEPAVERALIRGHLAGESPDFDAAQREGRLPRDPSRGRLLAGRAKDALVRRSP